MSILRPVGHLIQRGQYNARRAAIVVLSPIAEKQPLKVLAVDAPVVLSFRRVALAAIIYAFIRQMGTAGLAGWPEVTFAALILLVVLFLGAFEKASTADAVGVLTHLVDKFGVGQGRTDAEAPKQFAAAMTEAEERTRKLDEKYGRGPTGEPRVSNPPTPGAAPPGGE